MKVQYSSYGNARRLLSMGGKKSNVCALLLNSYLCATATARAALDGQPKIFQ